MTYPREADSRSASRTPVAPGHGAAALQSWQVAVIALLQAGRTPVAACADAHVSVRQFRDSYTHDLLFRDACLAAIAAARVGAHEASLDTRALSTPRPDSVPAHALPAWAPALFDALLKGMPPEAAYKEAGVPAADVRRERQRNLLFRQAFQAASSSGAEGSGRKKYEPLLDRAVADSVVAARVIAWRINITSARAESSKRESVKKRTLGPTPPKAVIDEVSASRTRPKRAPATACTPRRAPRNHHRARASPPRLVAASASAPIAEA